MLESRGCLQFGRVHDVVDEFAIMPDLWKTMDIYAIWLGYLVVMTSFSVLSEWYMLI